MITVLDGVGAEKFAEHAWRFADKLVREQTNGRCWCESAECSEHGANSAHTHSLHGKRQRLQMKIDKRLYTKEEYRKLKRENNNVKLQKPCTET